MIVVPPANEPSVWIALLDILPILAGAVIGVAGTLVGTRYTSHLDEIRSRRADKRAKLEALVHAAYALDTWFDQERSAYLFDGPRNTTHSPISTIETAALLHLPALRDCVADLKLETINYRKWIIEGYKQKLLANPHLVPQAHLDLFGAVYDAFSTKCNDLLQAARQAMQEIDR